MPGLSGIKDTVMQVADAITAALEIETEIIDSRLRIIGGTGRYAAKIGQYEENGDVESGLIYSRLLKSGETYVCADPSKDPHYEPKEEELAEICCPIKLGDEVIGLIGLVAFDIQQKEKILRNQETLALFLTRMADLIASKLVQTESSNQLKAIVESIHEGLIAVDRDLMVLSCNNRCEELLGVQRGRIEGRRLSEVWENGDVREVMASGEPLKDREIIFKSDNGKEKRFLATIVPISEAAGQEESASILGAMILFQDISDVHERIYRFTTMEKYTTFDDILGDSPAILGVKQRALQVATSDSTILITGESGTGKELFARAIHYASNRRENSFVAVNCGAIPEMLLESELFGYEKGAFTGAHKNGKPGKFEIAHKGTIFLDEIGDLPLHLQVKLLHAIQNSRIDRIGGISPIDVDVRIIAATNKNLETMIQMREFREDLYFRLNVIPLMIPPLRERAGDVALLLGCALEKFNALLQKKILAFTDRSMEALLRYNWPGNVRELENVVEYAVNMEKGDRIGEENLPDRIQRAEPPQGGRSEGLKEKLDRYQKQLIESCLKETGHSLEGKLQAAKLLGISESTLYRRIRELGIEK